MTGTLTMEKITKSGVYKDLPMAIYHGDCCDSASVSSSVLRAVEEFSLRHGWLQSHLNPDRQQAPRDAFRIGTALHSLAFEGGLSNKYFAVSPYHEFRTNEAKAWRDQQINAGRTVLKEAEVLELEAMRDALLEEPAIRAGLFDERGEVETSVFHKDEETGLYLKARPDVVPVNPILVDLKTTADASRRAVERAVIDNGYHQQLALAAEVIEKVVGIEIQEAWLVFIEKTPPYTVVFAEIEEDLLAWGRVLNRGALRAFAKCLEKGPQMHNFPKGYRDGELVVRAPSWYSEALAKRQESGDLPSFFDVHIKMQGDPL